MTLPWKTPKPQQVQTAKGCLECRMTGFRGRTGIYEMLPVSTEMKKLITTSPDPVQLKSLAYKEGMRSLRSNGAAKVAEGVTTPVEILHVAPPALE